MPLSINVGLSRKIARDFRSTGHSVNITAELDQSLLTRPAELQQQIDHLYQQAELALQRRQRGDPASSRSEASFRRADAVASGRNGIVTSDRTSVPITASQQRAINAIARRSGIDASQESLDIMGLSVDCLSVRQASEFIDHLKRLLSPVKSTGGER